MRASRAIVLPLGTVAVASSIAIATFDIIFAVVLSRASSPANTRVTAIVASAVGSVTSILSMGLLIRQIRYRSAALVQDSRNQRQYTYMLAGFAAVFGILSDVASATVLGIMRSRISDIPPKIISSSTGKVIAGGFAVWAISTMMQAAFLICVVVIQRKELQQPAQPYQSSSKPQKRSEMQKDLRPPTQSNEEKQEDFSMESGSSPSLIGMSRSGSDAMASFRSSMTNDRPVSSQTKLISYKTLYRSASFDDVPKSVEDGFDSWDTSNVDAQSRQAVEMASPTQPTFLETIPASPATSRSPSPGYPLDLEPPKQRKRGRKYTTPTSYGERPKTSPSKLESTNEAHIHPLFRTATALPPPEVTPGTMVTAAPGAGQVISDRSSLRSLHRRMSGSRPSSPLKHSVSLDSLRWAREDEEGELEQTEKEVEERTITPPIPEWIMTAGSRSSMAGYNSRRKSETGAATERTGDT